MTWCPVPLGMIPYQLLGTPWWEDKKQLQAEEGLWTRHLPYSICLSIRFYIYCYLIYTPFMSFPVLIILSFQGLKSRGFHKQCHCKYLFNILEKKQTEHKGKTKIIIIQNLKFDRVAHWSFHFLVKFWILWLDWSVWDAWQMIHGRRGQPTQRRSSLLHFTVTSLRYSFHYCQHTSTVRHLYERVCELMACLEAFMLRYASTTLCRSSSSILRLPAETCALFGFLLGLLHLLGLILSSWFPFNFSINKKDLGCGKSAHVWEPQCSRTTLSPAFLLSSLIASVEFLSIYW